MSKIIVGFSRPRRFFVPYSWAIRLFDGCTPYSHTFIKVYSAKYDRSLIYQASSLFVNFMGEAVFNREALTVREFSFNVSDDVMRRVMTFAIDNAGDPYDTRSILGVVAVKVAAKFGKRIANPLGKRQGAFFCSKLTAAILIEIGAKIDGDIESMTPRDIYNALDGMAPGALA